LYERHREERKAVSISRCENRNDVWILKARSEHDLALKAFERNVRSCIWRENLYDDSSGEPGFRREENTRHSSAAELTVNVVLTPDCRSESFFERRFVASHYGALVMGRIYGFSLPRRNDLCLR